MAITLIKKIFAVKNLKDLVHRTKHILKRNKNQISSEAIKIANLEITNSENAIKSGNLHEIKESYKSLKTYVNKNLKDYEKSKVRQNVESIILALGLALLIRAFVIQPFKIPSGSMIPTLLIGDHLLVNKFYYGTKIPLIDKVILPVSDVNRGDVIVFKFPSDRDSGVSKSGVHYIKRVIGLPGDNIDIKGRQLFINGKAVSQEYLGDYNYFDENIPIMTDEYEQIISDSSSHVIYKKGLSATSKGKIGIPFVVPEDNLFVMGDNRDNSYDSRFWGFVPMSNIAGKAFLIHWSWDFGNPNVVDKVRWNRIFSTIN
ncbi:MAG: signal peptidase I [Candidatus Dadabacteria bacterium]|nr:signal peptidase I [Candidatus Dadabacteria bacterium]NIQ16343.1 signal peptidase I [Candidatus Dadabacteria bacterium]